MDSTPPAMSSSASPTATARAPSPTAMRPEPHSRFTVPPGTLTGRPASSALMRATLRLSSPAWFAHPSSTSSTAAGSTPVRRTSSRMTSAPRSSGRTSASAPPWRPMGVRTASTTKTSRSAFVMALQCYSLPGEMAKINSSYQKLQAGYLFPEIGKRVRAFAEANPAAKVIRLGIGDVVLPLPPPIVEALKAGADELSRRETFRGYGPEQGYDFLLEAVAAHYASQGAQVSADQVFVSHGSKCDTANIQ